MRLAVYSIEQTLFEGEVSSITLPTPLGEITILPGHLPLISIVSPGSIRCAAKGESSAIAVPDGGIIEIRPESEVVILVNTS